LRFVSIASAALRRVSSAAVEELYLRTGRDWTRPSVIQAMINERCNYRCRYCGFWRKDEVGPGHADEMSVFQWKAALKSLRDFRGRYPVGFIGGEPFLKPGFVELAEFCGREGLDWSVCTNGSALAKRSVAERIVRARPFHVDLSVDSPDAGVNDYQRGVDGCLASVEAAIANLRAERERTGWRFPIRVKPVVTRLNFRQLPALLEWAERLGVDSVDPSPVRPWMPEVESELWVRAEEELVLLEAVVEELVHRKRAGAPLETPVAKLRGFVPHFRGERVRHGALPCRVGLRDYLIRPDGDVKFCWFYPPIGNVQHQSARAIWFGEEARRQREETVRCAFFGTVKCASSCLAHKTLRQEVRRGMSVLGRVVRPRPLRRAA
jgi:radical SAM protein with 4Fe4S-binding SPASM domain